MYDLEKNNNKSPKEASMSRALLLLMSAFMSTPSQADHDAITGPSDWNCSVTNNVHASRENSVSITGSCFANDVERGWNDAHGSGYNNEPDFGDACSGVVVSGLGWTPNGANESISVSRTHMCYPGTGGGFPFYEYHALAVSKTVTECPGYYSKALSTFGCAHTNSAPSASLIEPGPNSTHVLGDSVSFYVSGSDAQGDALTYSWALDDGTTSSSPSFSHAFTTPGVHSAAVTVSDGDPLVIQPHVTVTFTVVPKNQPPVLSDFTFDPGTPRGTQVITFRAFANDPDNDPLTYAWSFGDGASGTGETEIHSYASPNPSYSVELTVTDSKGASSTLTKTLAVAPNNPPSAVGFSWSPETPLPTVDAVTLVGSAFDPEGDPLKTLWDFGDGTLLEGDNQWTPPAHVFAAAGTYTVSLTVMDPYGGSASHSEAIVVNTPPTGVGYSWDVDPPRQGQTVYFVASAADADPQALTYTWDFGDGSPAKVGTSASELHVFDTPGIYTVTLSVSDGIAPAVLSSNALQVLPNSAPSGVGFSWAPALPRPLLDPVTFVGSANDPDGDAFTTIWDFGDGTRVELSGVDALTPPPHTYPGAQLYSVSLTVLDPYGASATQTEAVGVNTPPSASLSVDPSTALVGQDVTLDAGASTDTDGTPSQSLVYIFEVDGQPLAGSSSAPQLVHKFSTEGSHTVTVWVADGIGEPVSSTADVSILKEEQGLAYCNGSNPVSHAGGNKYQVETDYVGTGPFPLVLARHYNSQQDPAAQSGLGAQAGLGSHWRHSYERSIVLQDKMARVYRPDGLVIPFGLNVSTNTWKTPGVLSVSLVQTPSGWSYTDADNVVETYDGSGRLTTLTNLAGQSLSLSYDASGKLERVTDVLGRSLMFSYSPATGLLDSVTDPANQRLQYAYEASDAGPHLKTVTYPDTTVRTYLYTASGFPQAAHALTGIQDENGHPYSEFRYNALGQAYYSSHAGGADAVTFQFIDAAQTLVTDALGQTRSFMHAAHNGTRRTLSYDLHCAACGDSFSSATFDANGNPDTRTDFRGHVTDYDYDTRGLEIKRTEAQGTAHERVIETQWHPNYRLPVCVMEPRRTVSFAYDASGQLQSRSEIDTAAPSKFLDRAAKTCAAIGARADGAQLNQRTWTYTYYATGIMKGLVQTIDGPRTDVSDVTTYIYDDVSGNLKKIINALSHTTEFLEYDAHGRPTKIQDPNGLITKLSYDLRGRIDLREEGSDAAGYEVTDYVYDNAGNLDQLIAPPGAFLDYDYDAAQRLTDVRDQLGNRIHYTLDGLGNRTQIDTYDPAGTLRRAHSNHYWPSNQLKDSADAANPSPGVAPGVVKYMKPDGSAGYDAEGNRTHLQDAQDRLTQIAYDAHNRVEQVTDAQQGVAKYTYDADHRIKSVTDPNNVTTWYVYDGLGNLVGIASPDAGFPQFGYDAAGNLLIRLDGRDKTTTYAYDALNRIDLVTYNGQNPADYVYDTGANALGRLSSMTDSSGSTSYTYDLHGRVNTKTQTVGGHAFTLTYTYDAQGRLATLTYPSGKTVQYSYLNAVPNALNLDGAPLLSNMSYEPFGPLSAWSFGNGAAVSRQYDQDARLRSYTLGSGTRSLDYHPSGNVYHILDPANAAHDQTYGYDALDRLTSYQGLGDTLAYGYDANGNRSSATVNGQVYAAVVRSAGNRLDSVSGPVAKTYAYDTAGNLIGDGQHTYGYDDRGRYTSLDTDQALYSINTQGQRVKKVVSLITQPGDANGDGVLDALDRAVIVNAILGTPAPGKADCNGDTQITVQDLVCLNNAIQAGGSLNGTTYFVYDEAGQLRGEYAEDGSALQEYVWFGDQPVAVLKGTAVYNIYTDHLNTPRLIADQTNKTVWTWNSDPFGTTAANEDADGDGVAFSFNLRFPGQYFDRESRLHYNYHRTYDPSVGRYLESDPIGLAGGLNPYAYVGNNPLVGSDPLGLVRWDDAASAGLNLVGSAAGAVVGTALLASPEPTGITKVVGTVVLGKSVVGWGLNWYNLTRAFIDDDVSLDAPESAPRAIAAVLSPNNITLQRCADVAELSIDLVSGRLPVGYVSQAGSAFNRATNFNEWNKANYQNWGQPPMNVFTDTMQGIQAIQYGSEAYK